MPPPPESKGFTLVEISIVMIIIGLLIGGIFGGMKLVDNANVQKTVQDLKAIESAALTFKDTYRALPGDIRTPNARLPNCTANPCADGGDGNRQIDHAVVWNEPLLTTMEKFTFWHHLQAADLIFMDFRNTIDMNFGEGQPSSPANGGYRISSTNGSWLGGATTRRFENAVGFLLPYEAASANVDNTSSTMNCGTLESIDRKYDDGMPYNGMFQAQCNATLAATSVYDRNILGFALFDLKGF